MTPFLTGLGFAVFERFRQQWAGQVAVDAAETHLYASLPRWRPNDFPALAPSLDAQSPYRCHLAEAFRRHLGLPEATYARRTLVSQGVRHSLSLILPHWAGRRGVLIPSDVYPVYAALARAAGIEPERYAAQKGVPWDRLARHQGWVLLVCDPLKPWGTRLSPTALDRLMDLARRQAGTVLLDAAYDLALAPTLRRHVDEEAPVAFLGSLSKGWLLPQRGGVVVTSTSLADLWRARFRQAPKDEVGTRLAFTALVEHPDYPLRVRAALETLNRPRVQDLRGRGMPLDGVSGYFGHSSWSPETAWQHGVLALPPSVFGSWDEGCIVSTLPSVHLPVIG